MKKHVLFIALMLMPLLGFSQVVTDGLIGYWPLNSNANDGSGNGNYGSVIGASPTTDRDGNANSAYYFDGTNDYIDIPDADLLSFGDGSSDVPFSISFWVKPTLTNTHQGVFAKYNANLENIEYVVFIRSDNSIAVGNYNYTTSFEVLQVYSSNSLVESIWQNITITYDGSEDVNGFSIYVNGSPVSLVQFRNDAGYVAMDNTSQNLWFGKYVGDSNGSPVVRSFNGSLDDVMLFNKVLSSQEIQDIYGADPSPNQWVGASNESSLINRPGSLAIGTFEGDVDELPEGYKLYVKEGILTEKVKVAVEGSAQWPDYVFAEDYKLPSLEEVKAYIEKHHHLLDVPSAEQMVEEGLDVAKTDALLLQKIEELTLYLIEMKEGNEQMKKEIEDIQQEINQLKEKKEKK